MCPHELMDIAFYYYLVIFVLISIPSNKFDFSFFSHLDSWVNNLPFEIKIHYIGSCQQHSAAKIWYHWSPAVSLFFLEESKQLHSFKRVVTPLDGNLNISFWLWASVLCSQSRFFSLRLTMLTEARNWAKRCGLTHTNLLCMQLACSKWLEWHKEVNGKMEIDPETETCKNVKSSHWLTNQNLPLHL